MKYSIKILFIISFLLLPFLTELIYVPECNSPPLKDNDDAIKKRPIHVAAIVESDTGTLGITNHAFLFHQLHCALKEQHSKVQIDGWKVDGGHGTCKMIQTNNSTTNIVQASEFSSPPEHSRTLCEILEFASKCAIEYKGKDKLQIVTGLLLHDEIGDCKIEEMLPSISNFHLTVFWVHGHRKPPSVHSKIVDYAILESLTDISPKNGWLMPDVSLEQLYDAQKAGDQNPILDSLYLRLKRMSDDAKVTTTTRKSRKRLLPSPKPTTSIPRISTTTELLPEELINLVETNVSSSHGCRMANKVKKRFIHDKNNNNNDDEISSSSKPPCSAADVLAAEILFSAGNDKSIENAISDNHYSSSAAPLSYSPEIPLTNGSDAPAPTSINIISSTDSYIFDISTTTVNYTDALNDSAAAVTEWDVANGSFLEKFGAYFGDKNNGPVFLFFIIFIILLILFGISLLVYCLWPKHDDDEKPRPKKFVKSAEGGATVVAGAADAEERRRQKTKTKSNSTESAGKKKKKQQQQQESSSKSNKQQQHQSSTSNKKDSKVNKTSDVAASKPRKSPVKSILKKSPLQKQQPKKELHSNEKSTKVLNQKKKVSNIFQQSSSPLLHSDRSELSYNNQVAIDIPPLASPAGITPLPSAISYAEKTNMKFNDKNDLQVPPPELQPSSMNNNNNDPSPV